MDGLFCHSNLRLKSLGTGGMRMIVVEILGGLGNQLFQYALARSLSIKKNMQIKLDPTYFKNNTMRRMALNEFRIKSENASETELKEFGYEQGFPGVIQKAMDRFKPWYSRKIVREQAFPFCPDIWKAHDGSILKGYWQSEKYFVSIENEIRNEIILAKEMSKESKAILEIIKGEESVSLHVRRGDYADNPVTNAFHGLCPESYYREAVALVRSNNPGVSRFFVFSDDPIWVEKNFSIGFPFQTIKHNALGQECEDLMLMSCCSHHVLANSSFSWWGAWLCEKPEKFVVAPKQWFKGANLDTRDLIPHSWHRL